jgi:uncharacterized protein
MAGPGGRIAALDVLRGVAILGTLASNVWIFSTPGGPAEWISDGFATADPVQRVLQAQVNGKFLGLLTLLFGVGLELQYRSMVRRGLPWPGRYALRAGILFVEGLVHYVLVFEFDVLMGYAIASLLAVYLIGRSDRVVRAWGGAIAGVFVVAIAGVTVGRLGRQRFRGRVGRRAVRRHPVDGELARPGAAAAHAPGRVPDRAAPHRAVGHRAVPGGVTARACRHVLGHRGRRAAAPQARVGRPGWGRPAQRPDDLGPSLVGRARRRAPGPARPDPAGLLRRGVEGVGRTALSCYVLQNVLASALCYDWGLGLAGGGPWQAVAIWAGISLTLMLVAPLWLRRWPRGPIELAMHRVYDARRVRAASSASHSAR